MNPATILARASVQTKICTEARLCVKKEGKRNVCLTNIKYNIG